MQQAQSKYPHETGGVLGGRDNTILGVLPIANKEMENMHHTYGLSHDDIGRAENFLKKYNLEFMGVYHTHPGGVPFPSAQDLSHGLKHLFIVGLANRYNPELRAFTVDGQYLIQEPIEIISDQGVKVLDISTGKPLLSQNAAEMEMAKLGSMIDDIIHRRSQYPKMDPTWESSSFSTLA